MNQEVLSVMSKELDCSLEVSEFEFTFELIPLKKVRSLLSTPAILNIKYHYCYCLLFSQVEEKYEIPASKVKNTYKRSKKG